MQAKGARRSIQQAFCDLQVRALRIWMPCGHALVAVLLQAPDP